MKKTRSSDGSITVYLALVTAILLSFITTMIEGIRIQTIHFESECVLDIGLNSIFAEYDRQALKRYGLLMLDTSYGYENPGDERSRSRLLQYMNMNFQTPDAHVGRYRNLTDLTADNCSFPKVSYVSDQNGMVLKYQMIRYMDEKNKIDGIRPYLPGKELADGKEEQYDGLEGERTGNKGLIDSILEMINAEKEEDEDPVGIDNPADIVDGMRSHSILDLVVSNQNISTESILLSDYPSHRSLREGAGLFAGQELPTGVLNDMLYRQYLLEQCGYFREEKEDSRLQYQVEYLLYGKAKDDQNLQKFAESVFKIRYVINVAYLFSSSDKMAEAEALAAIITSGIMHPELQEAVKISLLFAWAFAESIQDVRIIFDGKKVAPTKDDYSWNVPLADLLTFAAHLDDYRECEGGVGYKEYLSAFLIIKNNTDIQKRFMDLLEMDVRMSQGNQNFRLDHCIYQLEAEVNVSSGYGHGYRVNGMFTYE